MHPADGSYYSSALLFVSLLLSAHQFNTLLFVFVTLCSFVFIKSVYFRLLFVFTCPRYVSSWHRNTNRMKQRKGEGERERENTNVWNMQNQSDSRDQMINIGFIHVLCALFTAQLHLVIIRFAWCGLYPFPSSKELGIVKDRKQKKWNCFYCLKTTRPWSVFFTIDKHPFRNGQ